MVYRKKLILIAILAVVSVASPVVAQERYTACASGTQTIHEVAPRITLNDFRTGNQTVVGLGYAFSKCLGTSSNRLRLEASFDHVEEPSFRADAAQLAIGVELHPFRKVPAFTLVPLARIGREQLQAGRHNTVYGGSLLVAHSITLDDSQREVGEETLTVADRVILFDLRTDYTNRRTSDPNLPGGGGNGDIAFYGAVGLDQAIGQSRWHWTARAGYQTVPRSTIDGFVRLALSARRLNRDHSSYPWNVEIGANIGDHGYKALSVAFSLRVAGGRAGPTKAGP